MGNATAQAELWGRHPQEWADGIETMMAPLYDATFAALDAISPLRGRRVLDAGCGSGLAVRMVADKGALPWGLDASDALLDVARTRTTAGDFRVGEIEELPWPEATFDVVTAFNSIQYAVDPAKAVAELARLCAPGGLVAIGIWGDPGACETEALFARLRSLAPPPPGTAAPLACSDPGVVEDMMTKADLQVSSGDEVPIPLSFVDHDEAWRLHTAAGPLQKIIGIAGEDAVRRVVHDVLEGDRKPDGELRQDNVMRYVVARKPGR